MTGAAVRNNEAEQRYELPVDGDVAIAAYELASDRVVFTHTIVPERLEGQGIGSRLIAAALSDVRKRGLRVVPQCPFVAACIERHPEERDLLG